MRHLQALPEQLGGPRQVSLLQYDIAQAVQRVRIRTAAAQLADDRHALLPERPRRLVIAFQAKSPAEIVDVPAGFDRGMPVNLLFFGRAYSEPALLGLAYAFEQLTKARQAPQFLTRRPTA